MDDKFATAKAHIVAAIEQAKRSGDPSGELRRLEKIVMGQWNAAVGLGMDVLAGFNAMLEQAGIAPEPIAAKALEFPNWAVAEVRRAISEVEQ